MAISTKVITLLLVILTSLGLSGCGKSSRAESSQSDMTAVEFEDFADIKAKADKGDVDAQFNLGILYTKKGTSQNFPEAVKCFHLAAERGHAKAQANLGVAYHYGFGVPKDEKEAVKWYRLAADQKHAGAQCNLGLYCYKAKDYREAVKWYLLAANQGHAPAQYSLGLCYANGFGVPKDEKEAVKWYRLAAEQGDAEAQFNLGHRYYHAEDYTEAVKWYRLAADQEVDRAQLMLGVCYGAGLGVPENYTTAMEWACKAAAQGNADAKELLTELGVPIQNDIARKSDTESDVASVAFHDIKAKAAKGDVGTQILLGIYYGALLNYQEAAKWYRMAAEQRNAEAQYNLGNYYLRGQGVPQNDSEAAKWYRLAAEQGHVKAQYNLGLCYGTGIGVSVDYEMSHSWMLKAAAQGHAGAQESVKLYTAVRRSKAWLEHWQGVARSQDGRDEQRKKQEEREREKEEKYQREVRENLQRENEREWGTGPGWWTDE